MRVIEADLNDAAHGAAIVELTDAYSRLPIGAGKPLTEDVRARLVEGMRGHGGIFVMLAEEAGRFVGIATCVKSYSTFAAKAVVNVHDLAVVTGMQGRGVGDALLAAVEEKARGMVCGKVTLEVKAENAAARKLYVKRGYNGAEKEAEAGATLFCEKFLAER